MKSDDDGTFLHTVYRCFEIAEKFAETMHKTVNKPFKTKIFSDNIIIALPCSEMDSNDNNTPVIALNRMTAIIGALQRSFLEHNILSRGSITYGDLFIDDLMVFGSALIQAYELESKVAVFPRVVLSKQVQEHDARIDIENEAISINNLREDSDEMFFLDYLNYPKDPNVQSLILQSTQWVTDSICRENDARILQKLGWHKNYLESVSQ